MPITTIRIKDFLLLIFCALTLTGFSQSEINGKVLNDSGEALLYANVVLFSAADTGFIKGAVSNQDGEFNFSSVATGSYFCEASMVGFTKSGTDVFSIDGSSGNFDLGEIALSDNLELKEVEIVAQKSMIEVRPDKMVFNVAATPSVSGIDALELLRRAPGVNVDMDNNIALLGKSGVRIFINGRPTRLSGNDLANLLQNMGSDNIEDIEIISNPSSKYEAEGDAGIININLKKNVATGFNGSAVASLTQGDYFRNNQSVNLNYGGEKLKASLGVSRVDNETYDDFRETRLQNGYSFELASDQIRNFDGYTVTTGLEYTLNEKHSLSFSGNAILNSNDDDLESTTFISLLETGALDEILKSETLLDQESSNYNFNLNY
ncbi:MAG: iron complex outermembrane receptor protein, partial [Sediminicola sp.]